MKLIFFYLILFSCCFTASSAKPVSTNTLVTNVSLSERFGPTFYYIKQGDIFKSPITGWLFNRENTTRILSNDIEVESLRIENQKLNNINTALKDANEYYKTQFDYLKIIGAIGKNLKPKKDFERFLLLFGGFAGGVIITIGVIKLGSWILTSSGFSYNNNLDSSLINIRW
jgi:hypothetical protein